jgi:cytochrome P450
VAIRARIKTRAAFSFDSRHTSLRPQSEDGVNNIAPIVDFDDKTYDPFAVEEAAFGDIEDIYGPLAALRKKGPVHKGDLLTLLGWTPDPNQDPNLQYTILGVDEVMTVSGDQELFSTEAYAHNIAQTFGRTVSVLGPPEHGRIRRVFQKAFLPHIVAKWGEELVTPVVNGLIDKFVDRGYADLAEEFALQYPFEIIYRQLALPERDIATFHKLAISMTQTRGDLIRYGIEASRKLGKYFADLIAERRKNPGADLVSSLIEAQVDGDRIPDDVLISFFRQLVNAAGDTTYRATGALLIGLLRHPHFLEEVRNNRDLIPDAIDETLRWEGPVTMYFRSAARDVELGGVHIPKGAVLNVCLSAPNHDPKLFPDPERFDIHRKKQRHFAFGYGQHVCVGQHLARIEMTRALTGVLDRLPNLRFDPAKPRAKLVGVYMRTPRDIHVRFG